MTIHEIRDIFLLRYKRLSLQQGQKVDHIPDAEISFYMSAAQQDIQRRLAVVETSTEIELSSITPLYALPATFGKQKHAYIGDTILAEKPIVWAEQKNVREEVGDWYAIKISGHTPYVYCPAESGTLTVVYYPDLGYYQPSVDPSQTWGSFSGVVYSGNLILPDRYNMAILYSMLSNIFPDFLVIYEKELRSLRESRQFSDTDTMGYILGGVSDEAESGLSGSTSESSTSALDLPTKRLRLTVDDTGAYSAEKSIGWTTEPTIANNISSIVITSGDSEFTNYVMVDCTNKDFYWTQADSATITFYATPTTDWGECQIIVEIY